MPTYTPKTPRIRIALAAATLTLATFAVSIVAPADLAAPARTASVLAGNLVPAHALARHAA
jgi:hypothetical protein